MKRELEDGWFQQVEMPLPALLTMQSGGNKLRYATLMGIKKAKSKPTATIPAEALAGEPAVAIDPRLRAGKAEAHPDAARNAR